MSPKYDDFEGLYFLQQRINQLAVREGEGTPDRLGRTPPTDILEYPDRYVVILEMPGISRAAVEVVAEGSHLRVRGRGQRPIDPTEARFHRMECAAGDYRRDIRFPEPIQAAGVEAVLQRGLLTVTLPRSGQPGRRTIGINPDTR